MGFGPIMGNVPSIVENSEAVAANGEPTCACLAEQVVSLESEAPRWQLLVGLEAADISSNALPTASIAVGGRDRGQKGKEPEPALRFGHFPPWPLAR
jgi:hypothetical protein